MTYDQGFTVYFFIDSYIVKQYKNVEIGEKGEFLFYLKTIEKYQSSAAIQTDFDLLFNVDFFFLLTGLVRYK